LGAFPSGGRVLSRRCGGSTSLLCSPFVSSTRESGPEVEQPVELTAESLWSEVAERLRGALNENTYRTWFGEVRARDVSEDSLLLACPNNFTREWIEGHFLGLIGAAVRDVTGRERQIHLAVDEARSAEPEPPASEPEPPGRPEATGLNPKY